MVYVTDSNYTYQLEIKTGNQAPVVDAPASLSVQSGASVVFDVSARDADADPLVFAVDKGTIIAQTDGSITVNYQAPATTETMTETITVSVGDAISTTKVTIPVTISAGDDNGNGGDNNGETTWDANTAYNTGDSVFYAGVSYTAKWWTKGDKPDSSNVWQAEQAASDSEWQSDKVYTSGDTAIYQGVTYKAQWWTQGDVPSQGGAWSAI